MANKDSSIVQVTTDKREGKAAAAVDDLPKSAPQDEDNLPKPCPPDAGSCASSTEQSDPTAMVIGNDRLKKSALVSSPCDDEGSTEDVIASSVSSAANQAPVKQGPCSAGEIRGLDIATSRQEAASTGQPLPPPSVDSSEDPSKSGFEQPQGDSGSATSDTGVASSDYAANCRDGHMEDPDLLTTEDAVMASDTVEPAHSVCSSRARKQPDLPTGVHPTDEVNSAGLQGASSQAAQKEPASLFDDQLDDGVSAVGALAEPQLRASQRGRAQRIYDCCLRVEQQAIRRLRDLEAGRSLQLNAASQDREGPVIDLRAARRQREADRWDSSCLTCRELMPEVFIRPCGHSFLCARCFMDPYFFGVSSCPVCTKPVEGLKFSDDMLNFIKRRSVR